MISSVVDLLSCVPRNGGQSRTPPSTRHAYVGDEQAEVRRVIGYIDSSLPEWPDNEVAVHRHAMQLRYVLVRLVLYYSATVDSSCDRLVALASLYNVTAIVVPSLEHIGGSPERFRHVCTVETVSPALTFARDGALEGEG